MRAVNEVTSFCWFDIVLETLVKVSDTLSTRGCKSFCAVIRACSTASPATADVESCVTWMDSWAGLEFPLSSTNDRITSNSLSSHQCRYHGKLTVRYYLPLFGCKCWSLSRSFSSISILPRHLSPNALSCNMVMLIFDEISNKGLCNVS